MIERWIEPTVYWKLKGYGRLLLLLAIAVYGAGLLLRRIATERATAEALKR